MRLISERTMIADVANEWFSQYYRPEDRAWTLGLSSEDIYKALRALPETATVADIEAIIGNSFWARDPICDNCGRTVPAVIELGNAPDYESHTARACEACLRLALSLLEKG